MVSRRLAIHFERFHPFTSLSVDVYFSSSFLLVSSFFVQSYSSSSILLFVWHSLHRVLFFLLFFRTCFQVFLSNCHKRSTKSQTQKNIYVYRRGLMLAAVMVTTDHFYYNRNIQSFRLHLLHFLYSSSFFPFFYFLWNFIIL